MVDPETDKMFLLSEIHPRLRGKLILGCKAPLQAGIDRLRADLSGATTVVFDRISQFDFDSTWDTITIIKGFCNDGEAQSFATALLAGLVETTLADESWKAAPTPEREANVLPATKTIVPGRYPMQTGFAAFRANEYESLYVRTYVIAAEDHNQLIDTLLSYDGFQEEIISFLLKIGQIELDERAAQSGCVKHTEIDNEQSS